jgi:hypothetical protein
MPEGWVEVRIPDALLARAVRWQVRAGLAAGQPGERIAVSPGEIVVTIEAAATLPTLLASGTIRVPVRVEPGGLTRVNLARTVPWAPAVSGGS